MPDSSSAPAQAPTPAHASLDQHGKASYYYWHSRNLAPTERVVPAPIGAAPAAAAVESAVGVQSIQHYAWADDGARVKVYVPWNGARGLDEGSISCLFQRDTLELSVRTQSARYVLRLSPLFSTIDPEASRWRATDERITITLQKSGSQQSSGRWYEFCRRGA
mmetsp:Transcript_8355/g.21570  ORF Transcript_8355/g.21570 Transcript_8355/m.21570 type:complete len:163 (-) Transcript_8355:171-659(-)